MESLGGFHRIAVQEVKKLASALARHTGEEEGGTIRQCFTRLSLLLINGNAAILTNRIPALPDVCLEEGEA